MIASLPRAIHFGFLLGTLLGSVALAAADLAPPTFATPYGENPAAGAFASVNGIKLYYETYGTGQPLLLVHGNGGSIAAMGNQIEAFRGGYRILAADSRGQGRSEIGSAPLTYEQITEDLNALLDQQHLRSVYVLGWSDGGIVGLLLAIHHPDKVARLAVMGANLNPDGAYDWGLRLAERWNRQIEAKIAAGDTSQPWPLKKQLNDLLRRQPQIPDSDLGTITAPTLVMAADRDVIRNEHTLEIFNHLQHAHLCIFPGATHMIPWQDPALFNATVARFFAGPFTRPDTRDLFQ